MKSLNSLYGWLHDEGVILISRPLPFSNPETAASTITIDGTGACGIFLDTDHIASLAEEKVVMFHEGGHYATGAMHKVASKFDLIEKHENKADKWAIQQVLSADDLDQAVADGCEDIWSLAEYFGVTPDFARKAVCLYTYGNLDCTDYLPI